MIRQEIKMVVLAAVQKKSRNVKIPEFSVEVPENPEHGDYATNAALVLARILKKPPMEIARDLVAQLTTHNPQLTTRVEAVSPGFINFWLSSGALQQEFTAIIKQKDKYGQLPPRGPYELSMVNLEFISANPTGPLHVGHGRGAFLGDALANVLSFSGFKVTREYYVNDARASTQIQELGKTIMGSGSAYRFPYISEIRSRLKKKYFNLGKLDPDDVGYAAAQEIQKDNRKFIEKSLKIKFDVWYQEEKLYKNRLVKKVLEELIKTGFTYSKDNAVWFRAKDFGDTEDRVIVRTGGAPTYFLPDVAYHREKLTQRKFDKVIDILGADHFGTFPRVLAGLRALNLDASRVSAIFTQMVRLVRDGQEFKMSKRKGEFVTLEWLVKEVGLDAARYFFLEKSPDTHMDFNLDLAKERSVKNPVYYIQYAFVRCHSILHKAQSTNSKIQNKFQARNFKVLNTAEERNLIKKLIQFPEVVDDTARDYQVHRLTRYSYELARSFHNFYEKQRVITDDKVLTQARLALVKATQIVLQQVLDLLGISAPKKM